MSKKKIILIISVLVVLAGALTSLGIFKNYTDNQNRTYIYSKITEINKEIDSNNLTNTSANIKDLTLKVHGMDDPKLEAEITALSTKLIKKQNANSVTKDLSSLSTLIKQGFLSEATFEIEKLTGEQLSDANKVTLAKLKNRLNDAKSDETSTTKEINAMNTLNDLMSSQEYETANRFIENLNTSTYSASNLAQISAYTKEISTYQNKFNIDDFKIPDTEIVGLYKEAFPTSTEVATPVSDLPLYFIQNTPIYKVELTGGKDTLAYLSADGKNVTASDMITSLSNNNTFFNVIDGKKVIATSIPTDAK